MAVHVVNEARRCLNCKNPMCRQGCPINTPIPQMIQAFLDNDIPTAGAMLFENNPLSIICSLVCDHDKQCEGHCVLGRKGAPVQISSIENYISDSYFDRMVIERQPANGMKAAIIGGGPAGITIAVQLARKGYGVTIFDAKEKIGGILQYGIPEFRLPKSILKRYQKKLKEIGIHFRPNTAIGGAIKMDDLFRDGYKAVFIGTGVWRPKTLGIKGESLGNVHFAINYLNSPVNYDLGETVAIIGAGNSAMDVARTAIREGSNKVTVFSQSKHPKASVREVEYAQIDGVNLVCGKAPVEITEEGPILVDVTADEEGNFTYHKETAQLFKADSTIIAISQGPKDKIVSTTGGIQTVHGGLVVTDDSGHTTREGVFASGDVVAGARTVVEAVAYSKKVAQAMDEYMRSLGNKA